MRVIGLVGWSGAGKTTLILKLIAELRRRGLSASTLKHAHHGFDIDQPGKDSHAHRAAGATEVLVASSRRWALIRELRDEPQPGLATLLGRLSPVDLVLVEGFKREAHRKIEVWRHANGRPLLAAELSHVAAVAADAPVPGAAVPVLPLDDTGAIADLVVAAAEPAGELIARLEAARG